MKKIVVILQGTIGLGKSTVGYRCFSMLKKRGIKAVTLEQTRFKKFGPIEAGERCLDEFEIYLKIYNVIILQNNNVNSSQYQKYVEKAKQSNFIVIFFSPSEINNELTKKLLGLVCIQSIMKRNNKNVFLEELIRSVLVLLSQIKIPDVNSEVNYVERIDYLNQSIIKNFKVDQDTWKWVRDYYHDINENQYNARLKPINDKLKWKDYQLLRLPIDTIAKSIIDKILEIY